MHDADSRLAGQSRLLKPTDAESSEELHGINLLKLTEFVLMKLSHMYVSTE